MKANLTNAVDSLKSSHRRKTLDKSYQLIAFNPNEDKFINVIDVRIYYPGAKCYACIWIKTPQKWIDASGTASGYGYHKQSSAFSNALMNSRIELDENISGIGDTGITNAMTAIFQAIPEYNNYSFTIVESYA